MTAYATYNDFRGSVLLMIDGDTVASDIQPQTLDLMISLGESLVHNGEATGVRGIPVPPLRASSMEAPLDVVVAGNAAALPADFMEPRIFYFDETRPLKIVPEERLREQSIAPSGGYVRQAAQAGDSLIFYPTAADGEHLLGRYYQRPPALKSSLHATFQRYSDLYMYAALYSSAPFLGTDRRIPVWQSYYQSLLHQANNAERWRAYGGSSIRTVAR